MKDIDQVSAELTEELLAKALPPKLLYRYRSWMRRMRPRTTQDVLSLTEIQPIENLKKNEAQATFFDSGHIKIDFGPNVPEKVKKAALEWAKRKGLKAVESSLTKSATASQSVLYSANIAILGKPVDQIRFLY
jgi:hypothetical protein